MLMPRLQEPLLMPIYDKRNPLTAADPDAGLGFVREFCDTADPPSLALRDS
jgi:hypothetical protein